MGLLQAVKNSWRKNAPELIGLFDGSMPDFVTASRPREPLDGVPVFCYHLVEAEQLRADLQFLKHNAYRTLDADEFLAYLEGRSPVPERSVVLSFDDGPRNFFDVAFPLLKLFNAHALHFIAPGLHDDSDNDDAIVDRPMTWQEILTIHRTGLVRFQSHTLESRYVPRWPAPAALAGCEPRIEHGRRRDPLALAEDFAKSRQVLEARLPGLVVNHLSFPMYIGTESAVEIAKATGFRACHWGYRPRRPLNRAGDSPFYISRMSDELVRRLPGEGRAGFSQLFRERARRIQASRAWRRRFAPSAV